MPAELNDETGRYEVVVDGDTYEFEKWKASKALDFLLSAASFASGPLMAFGLSNRGPSPSATPQGSLGKSVISELSQHLQTNRPEVMRLLTQLSCLQGGVTIGSKPVKLDDVYTGKLTTMLKVAQENFNCQFGDFQTAVSTISEMFPAVAALGSNGNSTATPA